MRRGRAGWTPRVVCGPRTAGPPRSSPAVASPSLEETLAARALYLDALGGLGRGRGRQGSQQLAQWAPAVDVLTKDDDLVIRAELPGLKQEDVDITLQNGVLTISGEHKVDEEEDRGNYHVRERRYGSFRRTMTLPEGTDESKVHARFEDGVLEVRVEGAAIEQAPKRIEIEGSGG